MKTKQDKIEEAKREHMNEYLAQYRTKKERINILQNRRYEKHPMLQFCGKSVPLLYHDRAPKGYVWHHTIYDHADPEENLVLMSWSDHTLLHASLRERGIEIRHINVPIPLYAIETECYSRQEKIK